MYCSQSFGQETQPNMMVEHFNDKIDSVFVNIFLN
jgi:hypothetical protein